MLLHVLTRARLDRAEDGEALMAALATADAALEPARCGSHEPLRHRCTPERLARDWPARTFMWDSPASQGSVHKRHREHDTHSCLRLQATAGAAALARACRGICARFGADYGFVHPGAHAAPTAEQLERSLPGVFWANVLGPPYVEMLGEGALRAAPAAVVAEIAPATFYLQVTGAPGDPAFEARRDRLVEHIGRDAFVDRAPSFGAAAARVRREVGDPVAFALERLTERAEAAVAAGEEVSPAGLVLSAAGSARLLRGPTAEAVERAVRHLAAGEEMLAAAVMRTDGGRLVVHVEAAGASPVEVSRPVDGGALGPARAQRVAPRLLAG